MALHLRSVAHCNLSQMGLEPPICVEGHFVFYSSANAAVDISIVCLLISHAAMGTDDPFWD